VYSVNDNQNEGLAMLKRTFAATAFSVTLAGVAKAGAFEKAKSDVAKAVCVENASDDELLFVAEADGDERILRVLGLGETLCAEAPETGGKGVVGVFESEDVLEGCSRLAVAGKPERLIRYMAFDNCTWAKP
jgi:hypothetical protein